MKIKGFVLSLVAAAAFSLAPIAVAQACPCSGKKNTASKKDKDSGDSPTADKSKTKKGKTKS